MSRHQRRTRRRRLLGNVAAPAILIGGVLAVGVGVAAPANTAPSFTVDDTADAPDANPGDGVCASAQHHCTLRAAVMEAGAVNVTNIQLPAGTFRLTIPAGSEAQTGGAPDSAVGDLDISTTITITGAGPDQTVIDGTNSVRVFDIHHKSPLDVNRVGDLTLNGLRVMNGLADYDGATSHVHGGAIHNHGSLDLSHVVVDDNASSQPNWGGGGITNGSDGVATMSEVTVARNTTQGYGGGIENVGRLVMTNVTMAENQAPADKGGGLANVGSGSTTISSSLVASNSGGDCKTAGGAISSGGYNLEGDGTCVFAQPTDLKGNPGFAAGLPGAPLYYALSSYSPAEDTAGENNCSGTDIRGVSRPQDSDQDSIVECDMGSYEKEPGLVATGG